MSAQSRPQLNSGIMNRMTGLLSRMLNDPRHRNNRSDENNFDRVAEGISILFGNESGSAPATDDIPSTSAGVNRRAINAETSPQNEDVHMETSSTSSSSSEEEVVMIKPKFGYVKQKFLGHRNARTMIKEANFWGDDFVSFRHFMKIKIPIFFSY